MKKIKIQITHWLTGSILFEYETENNTLVKTIREANLWGANLRGANLRGTDLGGAKGIIMYWHIHHEMLVENLTEPLKNRIEYIKKEKPKEEIKLRLKLLKKVKCPINKLPHTKKDWEKLHRVECGCGWSSKRQTIFTKANGFEK